MDDVTLSAVAKGAHAVHTSWNAPSDDGGAAISRYNLYTVEPAAGIAPEWVLNPGTLEQDVFELHRFTEYCYWLTASNVAGESAVVGPSCATTDPLPPTAPFVGTVSGLTSTGFDLAWGIPLDDGGKDITNYNVFASTDDFIPGADSAPSASPATASASLSGLKFNTKYFVYVNA